MARKSRERICWTELAAAEELQVCSAIVNEFHSRHVRKGIKATVKKKKKRNKTARDEEKKSAVFLTTTKYMGFPYSFSYIQVTHLFYSNPPCSLLAAETSV